MVAVSYADRIVTVVDEAGEHAKSADVPSPKLVSGEAHLTAEPKSPADVAGPRWRYPERGIESI